MAAFGSKAIRHEIEKQFRIPIEKIPFSEDVFQVDKTAMAWFGKPVSVAKENISSCFFLKGSICHVLPPDCKKGTSAGRLYNVW